ncbi:MAG: hypothetical protein KBD37_07870 [Burkholderiales bacterium]|nr:hypothetical protein [Burkholderiales bacterium]
MGLSIGGSAGGTGIVKYIDKEITSKPERQTVKNALLMYKQNPQNTQNQKTFVDAINELKNNSSGSPAMKELFEFKVGIGGDIAKEAEHYAKVAERLIMVKALHKADNKSTDYFYSGRSNTEIYEELISSYNNKLNSKNTEQNKFNDALVKLGRAQRYTDPVTFENKCAALADELIQKYNDVTFPVNQQVIKNFVRDFEAVVKISSNNTASRTDEYKKFYEKCGKDMKPLAQLMLLPAVLLKHGNSIAEKQTLNHTVLDLLKRTIADSKDSDTFKLFQSFNHQWIQPNIINQDVIVEFIKILIPSDSSPISVNNNQLILYAMVSPILNPENCGKVIILLVDRCINLYNNKPIDRQVVFKNIKQTLVILNLNQVKCDEDLRRKQKDRLQSLLNNHLNKVITGLEAELKTDLKLNAELKKDFEFGPA